MKRTLFTIWLIGLLGCTLAGLQGANLTQTVVSETSQNYWQVPAFLPDATNNVTNPATTTNVTNPSDWNKFRPSLWSTFNTAPAKGSLTANYWHEGNLSTTVQKGGLGYDTNGNAYDYAPFLDSVSKVDVLAEMYPKETRMNVRIPFTIPTEIIVATIAKVELVLRFDDGFGAWLASSLAPDGVKLTAELEPTADNLMSAGRTDDQSVQTRTYDITADFVANAVSGNQNVLCLRGYNAGKTSSDFLLQSKLVITYPGPDPIMSLTWNHTEPKGATIFSAHQLLTLHPNEVRTASVALRQGQFLSVAGSDATANANWGLQILDPTGGIMADGCLCQLDPLFCAPAATAGTYQIRVINRTSIGRAFTLDAAINAAVVNGPRAVPLDLGDKFRTSPEGRWEPLGVLCYAPASTTTSVPQTWELNLPASVSQLQFGWDGAAGSAAVTSMVVENVTTGLAANFTPGTRFRSLVANSAALGALGSAKLRISLTGPLTGFNGVFTVCPEQALEQEPDPPQEQVEPASSLVRCGQIGVGATLATTTTFATFGDYGAASINEANVATLVKSWNPDFIVSLGDNNYLPVTTMANWETAVGNYYGDYILGRTDGLYSKQTATEQRFFALIGNHDYGTGSGLGVAAAILNGNNSYFRAYFIDNATGGAPRLPISTGRADSTGIYYEFVKGSCHFFMIDSNQTLTNPDFLTETQTWLTDRIAASTAPWKILACHHSSYGTSSNYATTSQMTWVASVPGINVVLQAHAHVYERLQVNQTTILNVGTGGTSLYSFGSGPIPEDRFRSANYGAVLASASDNGLKFQYFPSNPNSSPTDTVVLGSEYANDHDRFTFTPAMWSTTRIKVSPKVYPLGLTNPLQPKMEVLDASGTVLASSTALTSGGGITLDWLQSTPLTGLTIRIGGVGAGQGEYLLEQTPLVAADYQTWLAQHFPDLNAPDAQPTADPDKDSLPNFLEYALTALPRSPDANQASSRLPVPVKLATGQAGIDLAQRNTLPGDVVWAVEYSTTLTGSWTSIATRSPGQTWQPTAGSPVHTITTLATGAETTTYRFLLPANTSPNAFYRLAASPQL
jgi:hypothetical protein